MDSSPSKNSSSKGKVLFDKSKTADQEDIWDDRALIRAYERSVKQVKDKLSSGATTTAATTSASYRGDEEISDDEEEEDDEEDEEEYEDEEEDENLKKKANPKDWQVGDLCMAIYSEDGLAYPANILSIGEDNKCTVRYLHYLNEEEKSLDELYENVEEDDKINELTENTTNKETNIRPPMSFLPPPPPIPLPSLDSKVSEDDALHSMLISWYMSGYHTGFYYGLKSAAQNSNKK